MVDKLEFGFYLFMIFCLSIPGVIAWIILWLIGFFTIPRDLFLIPAFIFCSWFCCIMILSIGDV